MNLWTRLPVAVRVALAMPVLMIRYACSPVFRRKVRMDNARMDRMKKFVAERGAKYLAMMEKEKQ